MLMASKLPMLVWIPDDPYTKECYLEDFEGRSFKTLLPNFGCSKCVGLTCGCLIFYGEKIHDFWLVNPITKHVLHFLAFSGIVTARGFKGILVFSPSIPGSGLVFVVINRYQHGIWFSIAGKGAWDHVSSAFRIIDLHAFKGKIYVLSPAGCLYEMRLSPKPKLTILEVKNFGILEVKNFCIPQIFHQEFISSGENLYVSDSCHHPYMVYELDFGEMKWVSPEENTIGEYAFFLSVCNHYGVAIKPESWAVDPRSEYKTYDSFRDAIDETRKGRFFNAHMWYFPHLCLDVDLIND